MGSPLIDDLIIKHVNNIVENTQCTICDSNRDRTRVRYSCGHTVCSTCLLAAPECVLCSTPDRGSGQPVEDETYSLHVTNALKLLQSCQDTLHFDVYKKKRISEQLKIEKEIFPECIQAPMKYYNKRKSLLSSFDNKENQRPSFYLAEATSPLRTTRMKKINYVQEWLNQHDEIQNPREPFLDLNVNSMRQFNSSKQSIKKGYNVIYDKIEKNSKNVSKQISRKRLYQKSDLVAKYSVDDYKNLKSNKREADIFIGSTNKRLKKEYDMTNEAQNKIDSQCKHDKDESGIVIDDELIVIDDTQNSPIIDKDKLALLAVVESNENEQTQNCDRDILECKEIVNYTLDIDNTLSKLRKQNFSSKFPMVQQCTNSNNAVNANVPFYKMSSLVNKYSHNKYNNIYSSVHTLIEPKDVSFTLESDDFITTVKISQNTAQNSVKFPSKHSISVQTDICEVIENKYANNLEYNAAEDVDKNIFGISHLQAEALDEDNTVQSQDLFTDGFENMVIMKTNTINKIEEENTVDYKSNNRDKSIIIDDSDSDFEIQESKILVTADVHRSCDKFDYDILTEIDNELKRTRKHTQRGYTPNSSDSSEKENCDPNRAKKFKLEKKKQRKKAK